MCGGLFLDWRYMFLDWSTHWDSPFSSPCRTGSKLGISPLMLAAMNGHVPAVKLLLDMGSDINAQIETNRNTALTLACFQGRAKVVSLLLDRRANVEHRAKVSVCGTHSQEQEILTVPFSCIILHPLAVVYFTL